MEVRIIIGGGSTAHTLDNLIFDKNGNSLVDKVIRLEDFNKEIPSLFSTLNLPKLGGIVKKNVGRKSKKTQEYYDEELISLVQDRYSWELKKFNYKLF